MARRSASPVAGLVAAGVAVALARTAPAAAEQATTVPAGRRSARRSLRRPLEIAVGVLSTAGTLACLGWLVALGVGLRPVVVTTGSMAPAIGSGSLVVTRSAPAADVRPGQVVTVRSVTGSVVTHRVVDAQPTSDGLTALRLKGDANAEPDQALVQAREVAVPVAVVPGIGRAIELSRSGPGALLAGVGGTATAVLGLRRRSRRRRGRRAR